MRVQDVIDVEKNKNYFTQKFLLWPRTWQGGASLPARTWETVPFAVDNADIVPNDVKAVYAFVLNVSIAGLDLQYLLYIGSTPKQSLQERYKDYIEEKRKVKRPHITVMLDKWPDNLLFRYSRIKDGEDPLDIETRLWEAFQPPLNRKKPRGQVKDSIDAWARK